MKTSWICLIRHGETEWSRNGRHTSRTDLALTPFGEAQARRLSEAVAHTRFDHVLCSPRRRALQTSECVGLAERVVVDDQLREWDYGDYEGLRSEEIRSIHPDWSLFIHGCPGGESPSQMEARVDGVIASVRALEGNTVIFSHGHFLRVLGVRWMGLPVAAAQNLLLGTASFCILGVPSAIESWNSSCVAPVTSLVPSHP